MGRARKHVIEGSLQGCPAPGEGEQIVRVVENRGANIIEVEHADGTKSLSLLPAKFRKKLWVKTGGYLIVHSDDAAGSAEAAPRDKDKDKDKEEPRKITGTTISQVLYAHHVKELKQRGLWPASFTASEVEPETPKESTRCQGDNGAGESTSSTRVQDGGPLDGSEEEEDSDDDLPPLSPNLNRRMPNGHEYSSEGSDDEDDVG